MVRILTRSLSYNFSLTLSKSDVAFISTAHISELVLMFLGVTGAWSQTVQCLQGLFVNSCSVLATRTGATIFTLKSWSCALHLYVICRIQAEC